MSISMTEIGLLTFAGLMYFVGVYVGGLDSNAEKQSVEILKPVKDGVNIYHAIDSLDGRQTLFVVTGSHVNVLDYEGPNDSLLRWDYDTLVSVFSEKSREDLRRLDDMVNPTLLRVVTPN